MTPRAILLLVSLMLLPLAGCGREEASILESDANGYLCGACGAKFLTQADVYADQCPKCNSPAIEQVVGYVCPDDKTVTLVPQKAKGAPCSKCGKFTAAKKLPSRQELTAWGAAPAEPHALTNLPAED